MAGFIDFVSDAAHNLELIRELKQLPVDPVALLAFFTNHNYNVSIEECHKMVQAINSSVDVARYFPDAY